MMALVNKLKSMITGKLLWGAIIVLSTLLTVSTIDNRAKTTQITELTLLADRSVEQNKRMNLEIVDLKKKLETEPSKQIEIAKEVMVEICKGGVTKSKIESLPSKREVTHEAIPTNTADIDDRLPADLIRLLN